MKKNNQMVHNRHCPDNNLVYAHGNVCKCPGSNHSSGRCKRNFGRAGTSLQHMPGADPGDLLAGEQISAGSGKRWMRWHHAGSTGMTSRKNGQAGSYKPEGYQTKYDRSCGLPVRSFKRWGGYGRTTDAVSRRITDRGKTGCRRDV